MLKPSEVEEKYNVSQSALLSWERRGYLNPCRTPGGHRRYPEDQIQELLRVTKSPILYNVRYDNYAAMPDVIRVIGNYGIGETSWWGDDVPDPMGVSLVEMSSYRRQGFTKTIPFPGVFVDVYIRNSVDTGIRVISDFMRYVEPLDSKDGSLVITTKQIWKDKQNWELDNRYLRSPDALWVAEAHHKHDLIEVKYVEYVREDD